MNIHEAAEIVRSRVKTTGVNFGTLDTAKAVLVETMLSELDPTPITEELLRANGWEQKREGWRHGQLWILFSDYHQSWEVEAWRIGRLVGKWRIKALGELRTLLRLMGEMK